MTTPDRQIRLAYLAGFLDGEGNIRVALNPASKGRNYYLRISATQVDPTPLVMLQEQFGGYVYRRVRSQERPRADGFNRQDISDWVLSGPLACVALQSLLPYLVVKAEAARLGIQFQISKRPNAGPGSRRKLTGWEIAERQSFAEALTVRTNHTRVGGVGPAAER